MNYGYIYIHRNLDNGKVYIGQSVQNPARRFRKTEAQYNSYKTCPAMYNALLAHGWSRFETEIILYADSQESLNHFEELFIKEYNSIAPNGYNTVSFSEGRGRQAESTKQKISEKRKAYVQRMGNLGPACNRKKHRITDGIEEKHCGICDTWYPLNEFGQYKSTWDGLHRKCKACHREYSQNHRKKNPSKKLSNEELKQSYEKRKSKMITSIQSFYQNNPDHIEKLREARSKSIERIDPKTNEIKKYSSALDAMKDGFNNSCISTAISKNLMYKGFYWRFEQKEKAE